jgi:hypothetical protein
MASKEISFNELFDSELPIDIYKARKQEEWSGNPFSKEQFDKLLEQIKIRYDRFGYAGLICLSKPDMVFILNRLGHQVLTRLNKMDALYQLEDVLLQKK